MEKDELEPMCGSVVMTKDAECKKSSTVAVVMMGGGSPDRPPPRAGGVRAAESDRAGRRLA